MVQHFLVCGRSLTTKPSPWKTGQAILKETLKIISTATSRQVQVTQELLNSVNKNIQVYFMHEYKLSVITHTFQVQIQNEKIEESQKYIFFLQLTQIKCVIEQFHFLGIKCFHLCYDNIIFKVVQKSKMGSFSLPPPSGPGCLPTLLLLLKSHLALRWLMYCSIALKRFPVRDGTSSQTPFTSVRVTASTTFSWARSMGMTPRLMALSTSEDR